jgi:hypothetical protein
MQSSLGGGASKRSRGALSPQERYNDVDDLDEDEARGSKRFLSEVRREPTWLRFFPFSSATPRFFFSKKRLSTSSSLFSFPPCSAQKRRTSVSAQKTNKQAGRRRELYEPPPGRCDREQGAWPRRSSGAQDSENGGRREQRRRSWERRRRWRRRRRRQRRRKRPGSSRVPDPDDGRRQRVLEGPELRVSCAGL